MKFFLVLALAVTVALLIFILQNSSVVTLSFLTFHFEGSLAVILLAVFGAGFITGIFVLLPSVLKKTLKSRTQK